MSRVQQRMPQVMTITRNCNRDRLYHREYESCMLAVRNALKCSCAGSD